MSTLVQTVVAGIADLRDEDPVLPAAISLATTLAAELHLVHGFQLPDPLLEAHIRAGMLNNDGLRRHQEGLEARLEALARRYSKSARIHCHASTGTPDRVIIEVAEEYGADLVIVGATRRSTLGRTILGTTAQRVVRAVRIPTFVLRGKAITSAKRVLLTTDLSELSAAVHGRALELLAGIKGSTELELRSLLVISYDVSLPPPLRRSVLGEVANAELGEFLASVSPGGSPIEERIRLGDPAKEIINEAAAWDADLVVVGTHGRGRATRFLIGSVAESVVRAALCSVLIVPAAAVDSEVKALNLEFKREVNDVAITGGGPHG